MQDLAILVPAAIVGLGLLSVLSRKPKDTEGHIILTSSDRIVGATILACLAAVFIFSQIGLYGITNPLILVSPMLLAAIVVLKYQDRGKKK